MKVSLFVLLLAALLVAMLVPAFAVTADNGVLAPNLDGTKITIQEEVGGILSAENMTARAAVPNVELAVSTNMIDRAKVSETGAVHYAYLANYGSYKSTPGAGGDGFARSTQRLTG